MAEKKRILIVDDDTEIRDLLEFDIASSGYFVDTASDGMEGLTKALNNKYDLILLDVMMPKMDGFELAENIRQTDKTTPIIFMSAKDDKPAKMYGYKLGIDDYITKPFDVDVLMMKVAVLLRRAKIETEQKIVVGNFTMNAEERTAVLDGEEIPFTVREFDILFKLLSYPKKTAS